VTSAELVSVVVPSYGHAAHLEEALRSIAAQSHPALELIVVDDASHDGSRVVAERVLGDPAFVARFDGGVRLVVHAANRGAHAALNTGLGLATGAYLTILNADDAYEPGRISALVSALADADRALAFSRVAFRSDLRGAFADAEHFRLRRHQDGIPRHPSLGFACLCSNVALTTGNLFFTRRLWDQIGAFSELRYCHDWDWLLRALAMEEPVWVGEPLYRYRIHGGNSYLGLADVAEAETAIVLGRYFETVRNGTLRNSLAPSPEHWPGVFEHVMSAHGFWRHW
jgi:glycosyltransferase involved in cell wall biosynthesis